MRVHLKSYISRSRLKTDFVDLMEAGFCLYIAFIEKSDTERTDTILKDEDCFEYKPPGGLGRRAVVIY